MNYEMEIASLKDQLINKFSEAGNLSDKEIINSFQKLESFFELIEEYKESKTVEEKNSMEWITFKVKVSEYEDAIKKSIEFKRLHFFKGIIFGLFGRSRLAAMKNIFQFLLKEQNETLRIKLIDFQYVSGRSGRKQNPETVNYLRIILQNFIKRKTESFSADSFKVYGNWDDVLELYRQNKLPETGTFSQRLICTTDDIDIFITECLKMMGQFEHLTIKNFFILLLMVNKHSQYFYFYIVEVQMLFIMFHKLAILSEITGIKDETSIILLETAEKDDICFVCYQPTTERLKSCKHHCCSACLTMVRNRKYVKCYCTVHFDAIPGQKFNNLLLFCNRCDQFAMNCNCF